MMKVNQCQSKSSEIGNQCDSESETKVKLMEIGGKLSTVCFD